MSFLDNSIIHGVGGIGIALGFIKGTEELFREKTWITSLLQLDSVHTAKDRFALHWADALWIASGIYVLFSLRQSQNEVFNRELKGVALYGIPALLGRMKTYPGIAFWAGIGWLLHPIWDMNHSDEKDQHFVPHFYPVMCMTFDWVMGGYLLNMAWKQRQ